ncbi:hypothetical protein HWI77_10630 [Acinetobacter venetianus]|nr:hypothetical protein HWI77_10630 [Acinetobacter venetianus]
MYITKVLSYNGAWEKLLTEHEAEFHELQDIIEDYDLSFIQNSSVDKDYLTNALQIGGRFERNLEEYDWKEAIKINSLYETHNSPGLVKNGLCVKFEVTSDTLTNYIFRKLKFANEKIKHKVDIAILINLNECVIPLSQDFLKEAFCTWQTTVSEISILEPLHTEIPFLIFGLDFEPDNIEVIEVESQKESIMLERCITFEPEYYQAGLGILTYFGTVLRDKYSDQNATVKIEQHDLTVRMVIQSENGNIETIEKALSEYELVLKGETSPDEFAISPLKALELKNQLNLFKFQVESQKEIIALQNGQILDLKQIVDKALSPISHPPVTIINQLHNSQSTNINHKAEISKSNDDLEELIDLADSDGLKNKLALIQNALDINRNSDNPEDVKDSNGMKKLAKFLKEANEVGTEANSLADKGGKALELIKSLGRSYNSIAQWCGMPVIPNVFVKE